MNNVDMKSPIKTNKTLQAAGAVCSVLLAMATGTGTARAGLVFDFEQVGGDVVMTSSGSIDTAGLASTSFAGWGGTGVYTDGVIDLLGGTDASTIDTSFAFHSGTDFTPWTTGNPWNTSFFSFSFVGTKGFATFVNAVGGGYDPGLAISSSHLVGSVWTTDQIWTATGETLASIGLNPGTYTVTDSVSGEFITFQIGPAPAPEPATLALFGLGALALGARRRTPC